MHETRLRAALADRSTLEPHANANAQERMVERDIGPWHRMNGAAEEIPLHFKRPHLSGSCGVVLKVDIEEQSASHWNHESGVKDEGDFGDVIAGASPSICAGDID